MENILTAYSSVFSWVMTNVGTLITTITSTPLLLIGFGMIAVSAVIARLRALV